MNRKECAGVAIAKTPNHQQEGTLSLDLCQTTSAEMRPEFAVTIGMFSPNC